MHLYDHLFGTAATLGEALAVGYRYLGILTGADGTEIGLIEDDGRMTVVRRARYAVDRDVNAVLSELGLSVLITRVRQALGRDITPLRVGVAAAAPANHRELADARSVRWPRGYWPRSAPSHLGSPPAVDWSCTFAWPSLCMCGRAHSVSSGVPAAYLGLSSMSLALATRRATRPPTA